MYQEIISAKRGKLSDAVMILLFVLLIFIFEALAVALREIATVPVMIFQAAFVAFVIFFCIWYYKKRLLSIRYTLFTDRADIFSQISDKPEGFSDFENGSFLVENLLGYTGDFIAMIHLSEMKELHMPGETFDIEKHITLNATMFSKKTACSLVFEQEGKTYLLRFHPSDTLKNALKEYIENDR